MTENEIFFTKGIAENYYRRESLVFNQTELDGVLSEIDSIATANPTWNEIRVLKAAFSNESLFSGGLESFENGVVIRSFNDLQRMLPSISGPAGADGNDGINVTITSTTDQTTFDNATPSATELIVLYA